MNFQNFLSIIALLGIGATIPKIFEYFFDKQKIRDQTNHDFKQARYKTVILLMYSLLDFEKHKKSLHLNNRNFEHKGELEDELRTELTTRTLYASDNVIKSLKYFIENSDNRTYNITTLAMRKDLYNIKTKLIVKDLLHNNE